MEDPIENEDKSDLLAWIEEQQKPQKMAEPPGGAENRPDSLPDTAPAQDPAEIETRPLGKKSQDLQAAEEPYIQIAQRSDIGLSRTRNEDACFSFVAQASGDNPLLPFSLCIVADGMGGHHDGHVISRKVTLHIAHHVLTQVYLPVMQGLPVQVPIQEIMAGAVEDANELIFTRDPEKEGGTTLTCALIIGRRLYLVHVGDTRAYLLADDELRLLTTDHSIVKRLEEAGHITSEEAAVHPQRNLLYRALTGHDLEIDTYTCSLPSRGMILICSDGLWGSLPETELAGILQDQTLALQYQVEHLVETALKNGSADNVTGLLIDFRSR